MEQVAVTAHVGGQVRVAGGHHLSLAFEQVMLGDRKQALAHRQHRVAVRAARVAGEQGTCDSDHAHILVEAVICSGLGVVSR